MDHAIERLKTFLEAELDFLREEWKDGKGGYKKLSDCPSYKACKAYVDAINVLVKAYYHPEYVEQYKCPSVKELI
ncbi:hypothetical protein [Anoxybacillus flavithermus]|uniref:hypothetical protein n=1 Tax=Anoxybacillus flavithermus TaxID=33934 RepID=UPI000B4A1AFD|nr:hypothetical protein [Anoxybacillus flavithermus]ASA96851.1 hypothetical protein CA592_08545 [Anoxybacillus flavithermus]MBE2905373.1 hypothetical protein [Anoxybacillus flavithermus]MBE2921314.1 hypothetical protein [Anoxybacillus flavithermus]MBE2926680.1 hypothetical protein [Anoxybacillus flavithermus]MBE2937524.1 hypothetical protein [Anoxybacillus flavithermus]